MNIIKSVQPWQPGRSCGTAAGTRVQTLSLIFSAKLNSQHNEPIRTEPGTPVAQSSNGRRPFVHGSMLFVCFHLSFEMALFRWTGRQMMELAASYSIPDERELRWMSTTITPLRHSLTRSSLLPWSASVILYTNQHVSPSKPSFGSK